MQMDEAEVYGRQVLAQRPVHRRLVRTRLSGK
jgi:hypothetical protein